MREGGTADDDDRPERKAGERGDPQQYPAAQDGKHPPFGPEGRPPISRGSRNHILDRHSAGAANPGKTKFPASWGDDKIMDAVDLAMAVPDDVWHFGDQWTFEKLVEGVNVHVAVRTDKLHPFVWTAYPR